MRRRNKNKSLFWYGFFGGLKKLFGKGILLLGIFFIFFGLIENNFLIIIGILFLILGGILLAKGSSQRFDYQRQSGHIMHGGDGWR